MTNLTLNSDLLLQEAISHYRAGRLGEAEQICDRVLAQTLDHPKTLHLSGLIAHLAKRYDVAIDFVSRAIAIEPSQAAHFAALGNVLKDCGRSDEAMRSFQQAIALRPDYVEAIVALGHAMWEANRWNESLGCFERASSLMPNNALIHNNIANVLKVLGRTEAAIEWYRKAVTLDPLFADAYNNLGTTLKETGRLNEAIASYTRAISMKPDSAVAYCNLGDALRDSGDYPGAIEACERAAALNPGLAEAFGNWGNALKDAGREVEAIFRYLQAIAIKPAYSDAHNNLGEVFKRQGKLDLAIGHFEKALECRPDYAEALSNLGCAFWESGRVSEGVRCCQKAVEAKPASPAIHSNLIFLMQYDHEQTERTMREELGRWNHRHGEPPKSTAISFSNVWETDRRLRIGYISADFHEHVVARNLLPLFKNRDRKRFEVFCYHNSGVRDAMTEDLKKLSDGWRDILFLSDADVAQQVRDDHVDILMDLSLHTAGNRLKVLAQKPAPVQGTFAGYPGSTGLKVIDFRLTDPWLDPLDEGPEKYSERSIRLESFWCYEPGGNEPEVSGLPALENGLITLGCLNNFAKLNDSVLRLWGELLGKIANSRLLLLAPQGEPRARTLGILKECGVDPERVTFESPLPRTGYFKLYHQVDLGLDTLPYNGHTTSLDSYWMGVPVVTLVGQTVVGRAGLSQLMNLGLEECVARSEAEFVQIATRLTGDLAALATLRGTLRDRMRASVLMDGKRFAKNIEAAYLEMWKAWVAK